MPNTKTKWADQQDKKLVAALDASEVKRVVTKMRKEGYDLHYEKACVIAIECNHSRVRIYRVVRESVPLIVKPVENV